MPGNIEYFQYWTKEKFKPSDYRAQDPAIVKKVAEFLKSNERKSIDNLKEAQMKKFDESETHKIREDDWSFLSKETKTAKPREAVDTPKLH